MPTPQRRQRIHLFQHIQGEGHGGMTAWLNAQQADLSHTHFDEWQDGQPWPCLPDPTTIDLLIIMGGAMSVNDTHTYPWLSLEIDWIRTFIRAGQPTIGLCLGAQLIAQALGAAVTPNRHPEIGWWPVYRQQPTEQHPQHPIFCLPAIITPLSWHHDTFACPAGAIPLAYSAACAQQAYQWGGRVLAFQFHPEMTPESLALFLADDSYKSMINFDYVQTSGQLRAASTEQYTKANDLLCRALDFVTRP